MTDSKPRRADVVQTASNLAAKGSRGQLPSQQPVRATDHRPLAFEARKLNNPGESRIRHFNDSAEKADQQEKMAGVFRGRRDDVLDYGGDEYDEG